MDPKPTKQERKNALIMNRDLMSPKVGGAGKYNAAQRKEGNKILSGERVRGQIRGFGIGGAAGGAAGAVAGSRFKKVGTKMGAVLGGAVGATAGQQRGDYVGNIKGQREIKERFGKSSAFGVEH